MTRMSIFKSGLGHRCGLVKSLSHLRDFGLGHWCGLGKSLSHLRDFGLGHWCGLGLSLGFAVALSAKDVLVLELKPHRRQVLTEQGLVVSRDVTVAIKATGAVYRNEPMAYAWILDGANRSVVWSMVDKRIGRKENSMSRSVEDQLHLRRGRYELYFAVSPTSGGKYGKSRPRGFWEELFDDRSWERDDKDWGVEIRTDEQDSDAVEPAPIQDEDDALVHLAPFGEDQCESKHIELMQETTVRVYAVGEGMDGEMDDYGWIVRDDTDEEVWSMEYDDTEWAGGAKKNRMMDRTLTLEPGDYTVSFTTDDSHDYNDWNALPPYDPRHWGLTLWTSERSGERSLFLRPKKSESDRTVLVNLTRVGDDRLEYAGFALSKPTAVRIVCLGELSHDQRFADYGWILNAQTRETVWEMTRSETRHAGGANKNRLFNDVITLKPGAYVVYYVTDGSHAFRDWNAGPPREPEAWGITLRAVDPDFNPQDFQPVREEDNPDVLAECIRVGDDEDVHRSFELHKTSRVRVYAVGEGENDRMFDYGWIEDGNGKRVWRMRYEDTKNAGGARKNRMVDTTVDLEAGRYTIHFRTDDSHAFDDWNAELPRDPSRWGITVSLDR